MPQQLKRKKQQQQTRTATATSSRHLLPTKLLSSLEESDKRASTKRRKQFTTHTLPKSLATKSQYHIQTNLIESRILLQRAFTSLENDGDDADCGVGLDKLLEQLVGARNALCSHTLQNNTDDDNNIDDDDDDDNSNDDNHQFQQDYNKLKSQWKNVLNRHYDNMNISKRYSEKDNKNAKKSFQVVDQSFWSQIENTVQHNILLEQQQQQHSLIQKRGEGKDDDNVDDDTNVSIDSKSTPPTTLVFDDAKIYQNMLQEYITLSTERNSNNATSIAEHRLKLASLSSANKKKNKNDIDTKASKGRKIRYVVHEKLKNFTFPLQREVNSQKSYVIMDDDVLFKSMMGGVLTSKSKSTYRKK